jgi:Protein of unknown function (DUF1553)/Protein of unknown function (DUF1549)/Concanavalin A-like lectin/glucanases superfamily/Planctomycete cytochrome C
MLSLKTPRQLFLPMVCLTIVAGSLAFADEPHGVNFATEVRPILSDKCFKCHGPDAAQRASDLRIDDEASVHQLAATPGKPDESELIRRIESDDADLIMPPPDAKISLSKAEREVLRRWVASGAKFSKHWSYESLKPVVVPAISAASPWRASDNPIDAFVANRLDQDGIAPSPASNDATLVRRLSLDLTGLPPSEKEVDQYIHSTDPQRFEQLVDGLLSKPQFGERWAIDWLDAARYADTHGYQNDRYRATWPWRDWVVDALNQNLPYDKFVTWQLAGDLLPDATREQILATAFNRLHRQTNEGGSIEEEFRAEYVSDRVNTFGAAFLGLTLECARCHDHKYDPISQREYYQLAAFFNNIDESGLYSHFTDAVPTPTLQLNTPEQSQQTKELQEKIAAKHKALNQIQSSPVDESVKELPADELLKQVQESMNEALIAHYSFESVQDGKIANTKNPESSAKTHDSPKLVPGILSQGLELDGENSVTLTEGGQWERNQPFTFSIWLIVPRKFDRCVLLHRSRAWTDSASRGYELLIEDGKLSAALIHFWPGNAIRIVSKDPLPIGDWCQVTWTYDGSSQAAGMKLWINGKQAETSTVRDQLTQAVKGGEANEVTIGQRFRDVGFKNGKVDELRVYSRQLSDLECKLLYWIDSSAATNEAVEIASSKLKQKLASISNNDLTQHRNFMHPDRKKMLNEVFELREQLAKLSDPIPEIMVMKEQMGERATFVLRRGQYDAPVEQVTRGVLNTIHPLTVAEGKTPNRLDLAKWLIDPKHPLTARVAVNRIWQSLFGKGLVSTTEDFGLQGASPTHVQLLDWLSIHYIQSGWDTKGLIKLIVSSQTYRQSSNARKDLLQSDPDNLLLARGPAVRLSAESLRDAALSASGLLVTKLGGPPVKPYQPEGLWEEKSGEKYARDEGEGSRRRSLYTFWKRTSPHPMMMTFDASNREVCVVRRQSTMTPLQTLVVLNDPQFVEAARALAERAMLDHGDLTKRLLAVFRRLTARQPSEAELRVLSEMYENQVKYFEGDKESSSKFLAVGDHKPDSKLNVIELAALAAVAEGLLSYDEFVMKR